MTVEEKLEAALKALDELAHWDWPTTTEPIYTARKALVTIRGGDGRPPPPPCSLCGKAHAFDHRCLPEDVRVHTLKEVRGLVETAAKSWEAMPAQVGVNRQHAADLRRWAELFLPVK